MKNSKYKVSVLPLPFFLAAVLSTCMVRESWADCGTEVTGDGSVGTNAAGNKCGVCGISGHVSDCQWEIKDGVLTITPAIDSTTGKPLTGVSMADFGSTNSANNQTNGYTSNFASSAPWARQGVTSVVVENGISYIGNNAFIGDTKITSVKGMENVTYIRYQAFYEATSLQSVDMPNVETIGNYAFMSATSLQSVDMPNVKTIGYAAFQNASSLSYAGLNHDGSVIVGMNAFWSTKISSCYGTGTNCGSCGNNYVKSGLGCVSDCGAGYLGKDGRCINSSLGCGAGYKDMGGFCNRIRYTPAEAAAILNDDDNTITITFKK